MNKISFFLKDLIKLNRLIFKIANEEVRELLSLRINEAFKFKSRYVIISFEEIELIKPFVKNVLICNNKDFNVQKNFFNDINFIYNKIKKG